MGLILKNNQEKIGKLKEMVAHNTKSQVKQKRPYSEVNKVEIEE